MKLAFKVKPTQGIIFDGCPRRLAEAIDMDEFLEFLDRKENTKIIFTGDVHQIDTPYLDENSNGLAYLIDRLKGQELFAHVKLEKGERSELANLANDLL